MHFAKSFCIINDVGNGFQVTAKNNMKSPNRFLLWKWTKFPNLIAARGTWISSVPNRLSNDKANRNQTESLYRCLHYLCNQKSWTWKSGGKCFFRYHDDVLIYIYIYIYIFRITGSFMRGIHRSPVISIYKAPMMRIFYVFFIVSLTCCWTNNRVSCALRCHDAKGISL